MKALSIPLVLCLLLPVCFIGCNGDESDIMSPVTTVKGINDGDTVWNVVPIEISITGDWAKRGEIYVNDKLIEAFNSLNHVFLWNTRDFSDGITHIRIIVSDNSGNTEITSFRVRISNILLTVENPAVNVHPPVRRSFIFISGPNGKFITGTEVKGPETLTFEAPEFDEKTFFVTFVELEEFDPGNKWVNLTTFGEVARGVWSLPMAAELEYPEYPDSARLEFANPVPGYSYELNSNGILKKIDAAHLFANIPLMSSPSKLFAVALDSNQNRIAYKVYPTITYGINPILDLREVNNPLTRLNVDFPPDAVEGGAWVTAFDLPYTYKNKYSLAYGEMKNTSAEVLFPQNEFDTYAFSSGYIGDGYQYYSNDWNGFNLEPMNYIFELRRLHDCIYYTATGNFDFFVLTLASGQSSWTYTLKLGSNLSIPAFEIPTLISNEITLDFSNATCYERFHDYQHVNNYFDYLAKIRTGASSGFEDIDTEFKTMILYGQESKNEGRQMNLEKKKPANYSPQIKKPRIGAFK